MTPGAGARFHRPLLDDPSVEVRRQTAVCTDDAQVLQRAIEHPDPEVRGYAALNNYISQQQLSVLARDPRARVRAMAAQVPALPDEAVDELATDPSPVVRFWIIQRRHLAQHVMQALAQDKDAMNAGHAQSRLDASHRQLDEAE